MHVPFNADEVPPLLKENMTTTDTSQLTSADLLQQSEALRQRAEELKQKEIPGVVARIKEAIAYYGLTTRHFVVPEDASGATRAGTPTVTVRPAAAGKPAGTKGSPAGNKATGGKKSGATQKPTVGRAPSVPKYRDAAGNTWSGFGPKPKWLREALAAGATEESLAVRSTEETPAATAPGKSDALKPTKAAGKKAAAAPVAREASAATRSPSVPEYRDSAGNTWSGFGPKPKWLKDALAAGATEQSLAVRATDESPAVGSPVKSSAKKSKVPAGKKAVAAPAATKTAPTARAPSVPMYRDAAGNTWSGFGPKPKWLKEALAAGATEESLRASAAA